MSVGMRKGWFLMPRPLLDHRYVLTQLLTERPGEWHYLGYHTELGIPVYVIAVSSPVRVRLVDGEHFRACAIAAACLKHQVLPQLRDFFSSKSAQTATSTYYAVFDTPLGTPFRAYLAGRRDRSLYEALAYGLQLCDALDLVERKAPRLLPLIALSPETLIVRTSMSIGLSELGVARWLTPTLCPVTPTESIYLAPEVLAGNRGDCRSTLYSIAAFLHHALAGSPPAESRQRLDDSGPILPPVLPAALEAVLEKALHSAPERRFPTLEAFGMALGRAAYQLLPVTMAETQPLSQKPARKVLRNAESQATKSFHQVAGMRFSSGDCLAARDPNQRSKPWRMIHWS